MAVLASRRLHGVWCRVVMPLLLVIPLLVAASRVYRGMHPPSDVVGWRANGACTLALVKAALLPHPRKESAKPVPAPPQHPAGCRGAPPARVRRPSPSRPGAATPAAPSPPRPRAWNPRS
ncbi:hypothetical protein ABTX77_40255 [Streptomyces sp. NPDC097704]|uniref:hypothetical protein n=1 Tax=Streptomyces sp. NPDC097704 TaxID=3157101 RepID=UPI00332F3FF7